MTHDRHLVKRWLPIEDHIVAVLQVSFNLVADLEVDVRAISQERKVNLTLIVPDDVFCARPLTWPILNQESQLLDILGCHSLRNSLSHGNHHRHT